MSNAARIRRMKLKNCVEYIDQHNEKTLFMFDDVDVLTKRDLDWLISESEKENIKEKYHDQIITKKQYDDMLQAMLQARRNQQNVNDNKSDINVRIKKYANAIDINQTKINDVDTNIVNFTLDSVIGKKKVDDYYMPECTVAIARRVILNRPILITGPSGCGKTTFVYALAKLMGVKHENIARVNFHIGVTEQHLIGKTLVKNQETYFSYGILPTLMQNGGWIILDEFDYGLSEHIAVLQPVLEGKPLFIPQAGNVTIYPHPNFRIFATANTKGRGDETQSYTGTNYLNASTLDRFSKFEFTYSNESKIIASIINDKILTKQLIQFFQILRENVNNGIINSAVFTTRKLKQIAELVKFGEPLMESIKYEIIDAFNDYEKPIVIEIMHDVWDKEHYANWRLGDEHFESAVENACMNSEATNANDDCDYKE